MDCNRKNGKMFHKSLIFQNFLTEAIIKPFPFLWYTSGLNNGVVTNSSIGITNFDKVTT